MTHHSRHVEVAWEPCDHLTLDAAPPRGTGDTGDVHWLPFPWESMKLTPKPSWRGWTSGLSMRRAQPSIWRALEGKPFGFTVSTPQGFIFCPRGLPPQCNRQQWSLCLMSALRHAHQCLSSQSHRSAGKRMVARASPSECSPRCCMPSNASHHNHTMGMHVHTPACGPRMHMHAYSM